MSVITFPNTLYASRMRMELRQQGAVNDGPFGMQFSKTGSPRWAAQVELSQNNESKSGEAKALMMKLRGPTNQLALHDLARPVPRGTLRGALVFEAAATAGDTTMYINGGTDAAGKTLLQGDLIGFGSGLTQQVVMVTENVEFNSSLWAIDADFTTEAYSGGQVGGALVSFEPPLIADFSAGAGITWDKPKVLYRNQEVAVGWDYESVFASGFTLNLIEDRRP